MARCQRLRPSITQGTKRTYSRRTRSYSPLLSFPRHHPSLWTVLHAPGVFPELQHVHRGNSRFSMLVDDPNSPEFCPSRRPCFHRPYYILNIELLPTEFEIDDEFLQFGADDDPRRALHTRVQGLDENVWTSASVEREGAEVGHGRQCAVKRIIRKRVAAGDFQLFSLRSVEPNKRSKHRAPVANWGICEIHGDFPVRSAE